MMIDFQAIIDYYYKVDDPLRDLLLRHSRQVADRALAICRSHPELGLDADFVEAAAMLHDIGIVRCNAPSIHCHGSEPYICHGRLGAEMLRSLASCPSSFLSPPIPNQSSPTRSPSSLLSPLSSDSSSLLSPLSSDPFSLLYDIARVCERHTGAGLTREEIVRQRLPLPPADFLPETMAEQVICYADKFYSKSRPDHVKTLDEAVRSLSKFGEEGVGRFLQWAAMFEGAAC